MINTIYNTGKSSYVAWPKPKSWSVRLKILAVRNKAVFCSSSIIQLGKLSFLVQQVTNKFCKNRSFCDKSTKFYVAMQ